jgi:hypothetical protein
MTARKFRDLLEPLRVRRTWARDAALQRVGQLRRELDALRANEGRLAASCAQQALAAQSTWSGVPQPEAHNTAVAWLAQREAERLQARRDIAACEARLAEAIADCERASAALDAVERQTQRNRVAHARAAQVAAQSAADADWLARKERP